MHKFAVLIVVVISLGFSALDAWAEPIDISGTHSAEEIKGTCGRVGGHSFDTSEGSYGCIKECANTYCVVICNKDSECYGDCPSCGRRATPRPKVSAEDAVGRTLANSFKRPSKPRYR